MEEVGAVVAGSGKGGMDAQTSVMLYFAVVYKVLLYGSDMCVMYLHIERNMGGLHHKLVCRLTGWQPMRRTDVTWVYLPLVEAMAEVVIHDK